MKTGVFSKRSPDVTVNVHHEDDIVTITNDIGDNVTRDDECEMLTLNTLIHSAFFMSEMAFMKSFIREVIHS